MITEPPASQVTCIIRWKQALQAGAGAVCTDRQVQVQGVALCVVLLLLSAQQRIDLDRCVVMGLCSVLAAC